jgi:hypothetical protein
MSRVECFTSATLGYFDRVRVLGRSLKRYNPQWRLTLILPDQPTPGAILDLDREPIDDVITLTDLGIADLEPWIFQHDLVELCTAVKGPALLKLLNAGADKVVYLDPDIAVFDSLTEIERLLDDHDVLLTPHQLTPEEDLHDILDNEVGSLKHGVYNLGFVAVANTAEGNRFAQWWSDRLIQFCFDDIPNGLFTDQRWCDLAPVFFPTTHILRHEGYNVASWNLSKRPIQILSDGGITAGLDRLKFFHFTKVTSVGERMIERSAKGSLAPLELMKWYQNQLQRSALTGLPAGWWAYANYSDGVPIAPSHRQAYRSSMALQKRYPHPFDASEPSLRSQLRLGNY